MEHLFVGIMLGYWIFYTILLLVVYHTIVKVYYFSLFRGILQELLTAGVIGIVMAFISVYFWPVGVIVIAIIALMGITKVRNPAGKLAILIVAIIAAIIVGVMGHKIRAEANNDSDDGSAEYTYDENSGMDNLNNNYDTTYENDAAYDNNYDTAYNDSATYDDNYEVTYNEDFTEDNLEEVYDNGENYLSEFVFPYSDSTYLRVEDLQSLTAEECRIARNEIYARHGRKFQDAELQAYFEQFDWYEGIYDADEFNESVLNEYEKANRDLISNYELEMGF